MTPPMSPGPAVAATASTVRDSYCSLAWGSRLANAADAETAANVLRGDDNQLTASEQTMAKWARSIVNAPATTTADDIQTLRDVGFNDEQIFAMTVYVALRVAFSTVNASLGARPDAALRATTPAAVLNAVTYGRAIED